MSIFYRGNGGEAGGGEVAGYVARDEAAGVGGDGLVGVEVLVVEHGGKLDATRTYRLKRQYGMID